MSVRPAKPKYGLGDRLVYEDRHDRLQVGNVLAIEASWRYDPLSAPLVVYTISHPSYSTKYAYVGVDAIKRCVTTAPRTEDKE